MPTPIDRDNVKNLVGTALAACPTAASFLDATAVKFMREAWLALLGDLAYEDAYAALLRYLGTPDNAGKIPSPGHIRGVVAEALNGRRRAGGDAFGDIGELNRAGYSVHRPAPASTWSDQRARWAFERLGGWRAWSELEIGAPTAAFRKQFVDLYDSASKHDAEDAAIGNLPGAARPALRSSDGAAPMLPAPDAKPVGELLRALPGGRR